MTAPQQPTGIPPEAIPQSPAEWFYLALCLADIECNGLPRDPADEQRRMAKCERMAAHFWPLVHYQIHGIEQGVQWHRLGALAARYARDFDIAGLADELWEVMEASPQDARKPWRRSHATDIAVRAHRFIERADAAQRAGMAEMMAWANRVTAQARAQGRGRRPVRKPGSRS